MSNAEPLPDTPSQNKHLDPLLNPILDDAQTSGSVSEVELMSALRDVELSHDLIDHVKDRLNEVGVDYLEHEKVTTEDERTKEFKPVSIPHPDRRVSTTDPMHLYLYEISKVDLLTHDEEVELAAQVVKGHEAAEQLALLEDRDPQFAWDEFLYLEKEVASGLAAKQKLIESNLRLVVSVAKRYRNRGVPYLDLIQEGNFGLMHAVEKFDYTKGFRFSTYATWWIRQSISRAVADQSRSIRIPVHLFETVSRVVKTQRDMNQSLGRDVTIEELAQEVDLTTNRTEQLLNLSQDVLSIEQPLSSDDDSYTLSDTLKDGNSESPPDAATHALLAEAINNILSRLSERDQQIVRLRFGMVDGEVHTLDEVGRTFGITRERVRQIETKVLARLRNKSQAGKFDDYLTDN